MKDVSDEIRTALMEAAAWDRVGVETSFLVEAVEEEEAPEDASEGSEEEQEGEAEAAPEEAAADDSDDSDEESLDEASDIDLLHALLSEMDDSEVMKHVKLIINTVKEASDVIEEEEAEAEAVA